MSENLNNQEFRLVLNIYCLYNQKKRTYAIPFFAVSDDDAKYQVARLFLDHEDFMPEDFTLRCFGVMDQGLYLLPITLAYRDVCSCDKLTVRRLVEEVSK